MGTGTPQQHLSGVVSLPREDARRASSAPAVVALTGAEIEPPLRGCPPLPSPVTPTPHPEEPPDTGAAHVELCTGTTGAHPPSLAACLGRGGNGVRCSFRSGRCAACACGGHPPGERPVRRRGQEAGPAWKNGGPDTRRGRVGRPVRGRGLRARTGREPAAGLQGQLRPGRGRPGPARSGAAGLVCVVCPLRPRPVERARCGSAGRAPGRAEAHAHAPGQGRDHRGAGHGSEHDADAQAGARHRGVVRARRLAREIILLYGGTKDRGRRPQSGRQVRATLKARRPGGSDRVTSWAEPTGRSCRSAATRYDPPLRPRGRSP